MMPILLTLLGVWLATSALLGLFLGRAMAGYAVDDVDALDGSLYLEGSTQLA